MLSSLENQLITNLTSTLRGRTVTPEIQCVLRILDAWEQAGIQAAARMILSTHVDDCSLCTGTTTGKFCAKCVEFQFQGGLLLLGRLHNYFFTLDIVVESTQVSNGNSILFNLENGSKVVFPFPCSDSELYNQLHNITLAIHKLKVAQALELFLCGIEAPYEGVSNVKL